MCTHLHIRRRCSSRTSHSSRTDSPRTGASACMHVCICLHLFQQRFMYPQLYWSEIDGLRVPDQRATAYTPSNTQLLIRTSSETTRNHSLPSHHTATKGSAATSGITWPSSTPGRTRRPSNVRTLTSTLMWVLPSFKSKQTCLAVLLLLSEHIPSYPTSPSPLHHRHTANQSPECPPIWPPDATPSAARAPARGLLLRPGRAGGVSAGEARAVDGEDGQVRCVRRWGRVDHKSRLTVDLLGMWH